MKIKKDGRQGQCVERERECVFVRDDNNPNVCRKKERKNKKDVQREREKTIKAPSKAKELPP